MLKKLHLIAATFLLLFTPKIFAQTYSSGRETVKETVNFTELAKSFKDNPAYLVRRMPMKEEDEDMPVNPPAEPHLIRVPQQSSAYKPVLSGGYSALLPVSATPTDTFQGVLSNGSSIPPDTHGAVDSNYVVNGTNSVLKIQPRTGGAGIAPYGGMPWTTFWGTSVLAGTDPFDPMVHYDPYSNRWIIVEVSTNGSFTAARILIAVSATSNPLGTWYKYGINVYSSSTGWLDFPLVGFNNKWITITGNYFTSGGSFTQAAIWCFDKAALYANTGAPFVKISNPGGFTLCPALTYNATGNSMFIMDMYNGNPGSGSGQLRLRKITGATASPVLSSTIGYPSAGTLPSTVKKWASSMASTNSAPQLGSTNKIRVNDNRINNLMIRNGKLWTSHTVYYPASSPSRSSVMWWQIDTTATPLKVNVIDDPTGAKFYAFPSIAANSSNDALIGYSMFSATTYPAAAYSLRLNTDPDSMRPTYVYRHGQKWYYQTFGGAENRWGDYSNTCVDPRNDRDFWTVQECVPAWGSSTGSIWDTWWAKVQTCPSPVVTSSPAICAGATDIFTVAPVTGATSIDWTVTSGSATITPTTGLSTSITIGTGPAVIRVGATTSCGVGFTEFTITPLTVPAAPTITTTTPPCITAPTATFTTTVTGATGYSWTATGTGWGGSSGTSTLTATVGTGTGTITVSASNICGMGAVTTYTVDPGDVPATPTSITSPSLLCSGKTATFSTPAITGATSYSWTVTGTGWSGTSTTASFTPTVGTTAGTISVNAVNACGSSGVFTITTAVPTTTPTSTFTMSLHTQFKLVPITVTYTGSAPTGSTYAWTWNGGTATPGTGAGPHSVSWATNGTKTVTLTVDNGGCTSVFSDTIRIKPTVTISAPTLKQPTFRVVPNPSNGSFRFVFSKELNEIITINIIDMQGKTVCSGEFGMSKSNDISIDAVNVPAGNYIANIRINGAVLTEKLTITK